MGRIETAFARANEQGRGTLGVFVTAGDPDLETSGRILDAVVAGGAGYHRIWYALLTRWPMVLRFRRHPCGLCGVA